MNMVGSEKLNPEEALAKYGSMMWNCKGSSMRPLIREGIDYVVIQSPDREIRPYDVVIYVREPQGDYVMHRVIKRDGDVFTILGDNCVSYEYVPADRIIGVMTALIRGGREFDLTGVGYRILMRLWIKPHGIRRRILRVYHRAKQAHLREGREAKGRKGSREEKEIG